MGETGIRNLRNRAVLYGMGIMALCGVVSLPVLGVNLAFIGGLVFGAAVSALNIVLLAFFTERSLSQGKRSVAVSGFVLRMLIYGIAFVLSLTAPGRAASVGTAVGFVTTHAALFYLNGVRPWILKKIRSIARGADAAPTGDAPPLEYIYERETRDADGKRRYIFVKSFSMTKYHGERTYVTYRQFKRLKEIRGRETNA
ncbi:MAG: hypothetical protein LBL63_00265 [Clostridiales Family XIII bacterium]|jgi:hypothetical protein|nr:hypothetical protein [Clostridiales Family XIII bacterium]